MKPMLPCKAQQPQEAGRISGLCCASSPSSSPLPGAREAQQVNLPGLLYAPRHGLPVYYTSHVCVSNVPYVLSYPMLMNTQWYISAPKSIPINLSLAVFCPRTKSLFSTVVIAFLAPWTRRQEDREAMLVSKWNSVPSTPLQLHLFQRHQH